MTCFGCAQECDLADRFFPNVDWEQLYDWFETGEVSAYEISLMTEIPEKLLLAKFKQIIVDRLNDL